MKNFLINLVGAIFWIIVFYYADKWAQGKGIGLLNLIFPLCMIMMLFHVYMIKFANIRQSLTALVIYIVGALITILSVVIFD